MFQFTDHIEITHEDYRGKKTCKVVSVECQSANQTAQEYSNFLALILNAYKSKLLWIAVVPFEDEWEDSVHQEVLC
jgi:hypothetical protein